MITIGDNFPDDMIEFLWREDEARVEFKSCGHFCGSFNRSTLPMCCGCDRAWLYDPCGLCGRSVKKTGIGNSVIDAIMNNNTTISGGDQIITPISLNGIPVMVDPLCPPGQLYFKNTKYFR